MKTLDHRVRAQKGACFLCRGRGVFPQPPALCLLTTEEQGSLSTQMPLSPPAEASCQPTQPCQQSQLIAGQQQSTKRERVRSRDNSHQSHRGHLAGGGGGQAVGREFFLLHFSPHSWGRGMMLKLLLPPQLLAFLWHFTVHKMVLDAFAHVLHPTPL